LTVTFRTFPSFDPEDYSACGQYQRKNFMFAFTRASTVKKRVLISDTLTTKVHAELDAAVANEDILDSRSATSVGSGDGGEFCRLEFRLYGAEGDGGRGEAVVVEG
jgi:hypothetical protein